MDKDLAEELDWIQLPDELESLFNKWVFYKVDETLVDTFATTAYGITSKKAYNSINMDISEDKSAWEPLSSSVPI